MDIRRGDAQHKTKSHKENSKCRNGAWMHASCRHNVNFGEGYDFLVCLEEGMTHC